MVGLLLAGVLAFLVMGGILDRIRLPKSWSSVSVLVGIVVLSALGMLNMLLRRRR